MSKTELTITRTESGDWFLVEADYAEQFVEDELEEDVDENKFVMCIGHPENVIITEYHFENER